MNRNSWSNIRGIAVLGVILIHITAPEIIGADINSIFNLVFNQISRFAVPIFLISSGFGLQTKYCNLQKSELGTFYQKRMKIIPGYLFWSMFYYLIMNRGNWNIADFIYGVLTGATYAHLYFMVVLFICYLLFPFVNKFVSTIKGLSVFLGITLVGQLIYLSGITWGSPYIWNWVFYFMLGVFLSSNSIIFKKMLKNGWKIYIVGLALVLSSTLISYFMFQRDLVFVTTAMKPSVIVMSVGILFLFLNKFTNDNKLLKLFDINSLNVYYVHPIFIIIMNKILEIVGIQGGGFLVNILLLFIVAFASLVFSIVFNLFKDNMIACLSSSKY